MATFQRFAINGTGYEKYEADYMVNKGGQVELYRVDPAGKNEDQLVAVYNLDKGWSIRQI